MSLESFRDGLAERRRSALFLFYVSALVSAIAFTVVEKVSSLRTILLALAVAGAGAAVLFLLRFLRSNDEREQQVNYRALTFAFAGTLVFSAAIGSFQSFGFHPLSWLGIPPLMIVLWSVGLILYSWRYR
jgi:heme/copper-type cytochrome/quinol oxidase subunit 4